MSTPLSDIKQRLNSFKLKIKNNIIFILSNNKERDFVIVKNILQELGNITSDDKFLYFEKYRISLIPKNIKYKTPSGLGNPTNKSVMNRLVFSHFIHQTLNEVPTFDILLSSNRNKEIIKSVNNIKFLADSIADVKLLTDNGIVKLSVNLNDGIYYEKVNHQILLDFCYDVLIKATEDGNLRAVVDKRNVMSLATPVAFKAPKLSLRLLINNHIRGGYGVVGNFNKDSFYFDSNKLLLFIKCENIFAKSTIIQGDYEPYMVIENSNENMKIKDLKGLSVHLTPKHTLPSNTLIVG